MGDERRSWFLASYLPEPSGWIVAGAMAAIGVTMLAWAITAMRRLAASRRAARVTTEQRRRRDVARSRR